MKKFVATLAVAALATSGCGAFSSGDSGSDAAAKKTVVLLTHDSWAMDEEVIAAFEKESGYTLATRPAGDAGSLTNKLVLTKDNPLGDAVFGIDNTFASRAYVGEVLADYTPADPAPGADRFALDRASGGSALTPIDYGDVCINVDNAWFSEHDQTPPKTLDDLTEPAFKDQLVVPSALTSSPGFAFLLGTIGAKGESGWEDYWQKLVANGVKVDAGWTEAYENDFTAGGKGTRPIVLSYSSSIPFTIPEGADRPTTSALLDTCFRQVEYAGVLSGADNPEGARALIDFMAGKEFQDALAEQMYVYPVNSDAELPAAWARWAKTADRPFTVAPGEITANRDDWLKRWQDITSQ